MEAWRLRWCGIDEGVAIDRTEHVVAIRMDMALEVSARSRVTRCALHPGYKSVEPEPL
jgi:hypothetical protein